MEKDCATENLPVLIPQEALSEEALLGVIDNFILREGTDYGQHETPLATKREQIERQLTAGKIIIVFDPATETVTLMEKQNLRTAFPQK